MSDCIHTTFQSVICFNNHELVNQWLYMYMQEHTFIYYNGIPSDWVHGYIFREDFPFCKKCYLNELIMIDQHILDRTSLDGCRIVDALLLEPVRVESPIFYKLVNLSENRVSPLCEYCNVNKHFIKPTFMSKIDLNCKASDASSSYSNFNCFNINKKNNINFKFKNKH